MALRQEALTGPFAPAAFVLPPELEAREPAEVRGNGRDDVRLLVTAGSHGRATHARYNDLPNFLGAGDVVVLNASATVPSSLVARDAGGRSFTLNVSTRKPDGVCVVEAREHAPQSLDRATLPGGATLTFLERYRDSRRLWTARIGGAGDLIDYLYRWGKPIAYRHVTREWPIETYQNVYANEAGSAEMPSAGRPFTREMMRRLAEAGVGVSYIVLHTGVSSPERDEPPYDEQYRVPAQTAHRVNRARRNGNRIIAVGTTVVRALESTARMDGTVGAGGGWTDLLITPQRGLRAVDGMITGFHEPRSTHLAMLETLAGREHVRSAYAAALDGKYLWHEFGDSHLLLPDG